MVSIVTTFKLDFFAHHLISWTFASSPKLGTSFCSPRLGLFFFIFDIASWVCTFPISSGLYGLPLQDFMCCLLRTWWVASSGLHGLPLQDLMGCLFRTLLFAYSGLHCLPIQVFMGCLNSLQRTKSFKLVLHMTSQAFSSPISIFSLLIFWVLISLYFLTAWQLGILCIFTQLGTFCIFTQLGTFCIFAQLGLSVSSPSLGHPAWDFLFLCLPDLGLRHWLGYHMVWKK